MRDRPSGAILASDVGGTKTNLGLFEAGQPLRLVEATPMKVILDERAALFGAARRAAEDLR